ncbi:MAG: hypothetical protein J07HX5_00897, partial [halophilic archaeon J07HX5]
RDDEWATITGASPSIGHEPAVVYRYRPDGSVTGYTRGQPGPGLGLQSVLDA